MESKKKQPHKTGLTYFLKVLVNFRDLSQDIRRIKGQTFELTDKKRVEELLKVKVVSILKIE